MLAALRMLWQEEERSSAKGREKLTATTEMKMVSDLSWRRPKRTQKSSKGSVKQRSVAVPRSTSTPHAIAYGHAGAEGTHERR